MRQIVTTLKPGRETTNYRFLNFGSNVFDPLPVRFTCQPCLVGGLGPRLLPRGYHIHNGRSHPGLEGLPPLPQAERTERLQRRSQPRMNEVTNDDLDWCEFICRGFYSLLCNIFATSTANFPASVARVCDGGDSHGACEREEKPPGWERRSLSIDFVSLISTPG